MASPTFGSSPPARYVLFPQSDPWPMPSSKQPIATVNHTPRRGVDARAPRVPPTATLVQQRVKPQTVHPACRQQMNSKRTKPDLSLLSNNVTKDISSAPAPSSTGLRSPVHTRFSHDPQSSAFATPTEAMATIETASPAPTPYSLPRGLRRPGDSHQAPASMHMQRKAHQIEAQVATKDLPKRSLTPAMLGTLNPATLSTMAAHSTNHTSDARHVRRKPVPQQNPSWHELRLRPSSPTLVETFKEFDVSPRSPPPTPAGDKRDKKTTRRSKSRLGLKSAWESDDDDEDDSEESVGSLEKDGLVERVRQLAVRRGSRESRAEVKRGSKSRRKTKAKKKWTTALLCGGCDE